MGALSLYTLLLKKASAFLNVLDNPTRWKIIQVLHNKGPMTVTEIYIHLRKEQTQTSQYLRTLRDTGFVITCRKGKNIYYNINYENLKRTGIIIDSYLKANALNYQQNYTDYINMVTYFFEPIPLIETYEGMRAWLTSFSQKLKAYNIAIGKKKMELLKEAKNEGKIDLEKLNNALEKSRKEGIKAFIVKYKAS